VQGSGRGLLKVLPIHLPRRTDENHDKRHLAQPVPGPRFETVTSLI
jgi:hypothetical protein